MKHSEDDGSSAREGPLKGRLGAPDRLDYESPVVSVSSLARVIAGVGGSELDFEANTNTKGYT